MGGGGRGAATSQQGSLTISVKLLPQGGAVIRAITISLERLKVNVNTELLGDTTEVVQYLLVVPLNNYCLYSASVFVLSSLRRLLVPLQCHCQLRTTCLVFWCLYNPFYVSLPETACVCTCPGTLICGKHTKKYILCTSGFHTMALWLVAHAAVVCSILRPRPGNSVGDAARYGRASPPAQAPSSRPAHSKR